MATPAVVPAPPALPPRFGLIAAATLPDDGGARWEFGATWEAEACGLEGAGPGPYDCLPLDPRNDAPTTGGRVTSWPLLLWGLDACSTLGFVARDWQGRARRHLAATESAQLAREMWAGAVTQAQNPGEESPYLADAGAVILEGGAATEVNEAIAAIDDAAAAASAGRRIMLHMTTKTLGVAMGSGSTYIGRDGALLTTAIGSIVVPDAGYPGTGPDADAGEGNHWIFASAVVQVRLGAVETLPDTLDDARGLAAAVHRPTNDAVVWAQRTGLYQLDPCARFAVQTDVPATVIPAS